MTQLVPATCVLGPGMTGLTIGLRVLNLDGTTYAAFATTGVAETSTAGTYRKAGGVVAPLAGGYIVWGTALVDYAEATVESASANVTMQQGVAVAAADADGNVPVDVKLWKGTAPSDLVSGEVPGKLSSSSGQIIANATKLLPDAGMPAIGSVAYILPLLPTEADVQAAATAALEAYDPPTMAELTSAVAPLALEATAQAILEDTGTTLPALIAGIEGGGDPWATALPGAYGAGTAGALLSGIDSNVDMLLAADTSSSDATTAGAISRRRCDSWNIPLTIGAITGYTSLWFTIKASHDDADTAALLQIKLNASGLSDGLLYVNGTTASSDALGSITVNNATTGAIVIAVDETITDDLAPGEYCYDVQTLIAGDVATPDSGVFTVTADVTRSVT